MPKQLPNTVFMVAGSLLTRGGGVTNVMLNRSKSLSELGVRVTLLTLAYRNSDNKRSEHVFRSQGRITDDVGWLNIYEWYRDKNTSGKVPLLKRFKYVLDYISLFDLRFRGKIKKIRTFEKGFKLSRIDYLTRKNRRFKSVVYGRSCVEAVNHFDVTTRKIKTTHHYTPDGYMFLTEQPNASDDRVVVHDRNSEKDIKYRRAWHFEVTWLEGLFAKESKKPILICDRLNIMAKILEVDRSLVSPIFTINSNHHKEPFTINSEFARSHGIVLSKIKELNNIVVLTNDQKNDIIQECGDYGNITVIPNSIRNISDVEIAKKPMTFSVVSRLIYGKRIDQTIRAISEVKKTHPDVILNIYGRGREQKKLEKLSEELGLQDTVSFKGHLLSHDLDIGIKESIATIVTTRTEGFSLSILESMACGTSVISYDVNYGPRDLIKDNVTGILTGFGDIDSLVNKINYAIDNTEKMETMGKKAKKDVYTRFSSDLVASKWMTLLWSVSESTSKS